MLWVISRTGNFWLGDLEVEYRNQGDYLFFGEMEGATVPQVVPGF
jgi:hypothetical protein